MTTPFSPPHDPGPEGNSLPQVQNRLLLLAGQIDQLQTRLDQLTDSAQENSAQLDALLAAFLTPASGQGVDERLAELTVQVEATREQVEQMQETLAIVATQEQLSSLERALAGRELITDVADSVKKLGRTQFKANTLGETREQQIEAALAVARELVTRREQIQERRTAEERLRLDELRSTARGEFAADLLPALDSIERALDAGRTLLASQRQQVAAARAHYAAKERDWAAAQNTSAPQPTNPAPQPAGFWGRVRQSLIGPTEPSPALPSSPLSSPPSSPAAAVAPPAPPAELELATELADATSAWLAGLELVRDRFAALLAQEQIQPLPALGQPFDPRLHLAIETETRSDAPPNTVVRVLRQGYRQRQRVLRYAEVVVARPPVSPATEPFPSQAEELAMSQGSPLQDENSS